MDSTNCSGFHKYCWTFRKFAYFSRNFERYNDLGICLWNPKQHRRSKKVAMLRSPQQIWFLPVAVSAYNDAENAQFGLVMSIFLCFANLCHGVSSQPAFSSNLLFARMLKLNNYSFSLSICVCNLVLIWILLIMIPRHWPASSSKRY